MLYQVLFSLKLKKKKKMRILTATNLLCALRVNNSSLDSSQVKCSHIFSWTNKKNILGWYLPLVTGILMVITM